MLGRASPCLGAVALAVGLLGAEKAVARDAVASPERLAELSAGNLAKRDYERRRAAAHSGMASTMYASNPSEPTVPHTASEALERLQQEMRVRWQRTAALVPGRYHRLFQSNEETAEEVYRDHISPIVQAKCVNCHVSGGVSASTRLVFEMSSNDGYEAANRQTFERFVADVENGAEVILNKIRGVGHGGGIQVPAGSQDYDHFRRFLTLIGGGDGDDSSTGLTTSTLFEGLGMAPARKTLRRAAMILAGRVPTAAEYAQAEVDLRAAVRGLMTGPGFHRFLILASNDRLLTDRESGVVEYDAFGPYVAYTNKTNAFCQAAEAGGDQTVWHEWEDAVQYASVRAPLELIAHVAENDLPYTEILTADYIMANPQAAEAYGAATAFDDPSDVHEFKPSDFESYYLADDSRIVEERPETDCEGMIVDPGDLKTDYPHAGILNTPVFMVRYPTTATNRNRARSRWTYYHFLGLDVEKSASRTTDPDALADTNNPTLYNPACTVCHTILDPVAGSYQNYDEEGRYRSAEGLDSLDGFYKDNPPGGDDFLIEAGSWDERELVQTEGLFLGGENSIGLKLVHDDGWPNLGLDTLTIRNRAGGIVGRYRLGALPALRESHCGEPNDGHYSIGPNCVLAVPVSVPRRGNYRVQVNAWIWDDGGTRHPLRLRIWAPGYVYHTGDTWYRGMRVPGFGMEVAPDADNSVQWLAEQIVAEDRFAVATVKFWWPAIFGHDVALPPEEAGDVDFEGKLLAANAQKEEVTRLATAFRDGFDDDGAAYNLKDLLAEMVLSKWFRVDDRSDDDPVRTVALLQAGANRLLTPEELARKTLGLTGVQWGRHWRQPWHRLGEHTNSLTSEYATLYGGIDSDGITDRARDLTAVMAGVAKAHAVEVSCPVVLREFYLLDDADRRLFSGVDQFMSPLWEFDSVFDVAASTASEPATLAAQGYLRAGEKSVRLTFENDYYSDATNTDRNVRLDRLLVRNVADDSIVKSYEMETHALNECGGAEDDHYVLWTGGGQCGVDVPFDVTDDGTYAVEIVAWADQAGDELAKLRLTVESIDGNSNGSVAIRQKLVELHDKLLGVDLVTDSPEISRAYRLFLEVWQRQREREHHNDLFADDVGCDWANDQHYLDSFLDGYRVRSKHENGGWHYDWNWPRVNAFWAGRDHSDPLGVAGTWNVVLMALLMDQRYLHL